MGRRRASVLVKIVVFALVIYAGVSLITLYGRIDEAQRELTEVRRQVTDKEFSNAELTYEIQNHNDPDIIARIARSLGLVLPGEMVIVDGGSSSGVID